HLVEAGGGLALRLPPPHHVRHAEPESVTVGKAVRRIVFESAGAHGVLRAAGTHPQEVLAHTLEGRAGRPSEALALGAEPACVEHGGVAAVQADLVTCRAHRFEDAAGRTRFQTVGDVAAPPRLPRW